MSQSGPSSAQSTLTRRTPGDRTDQSKGAPLPGTTHLVSNWRVDSARDLVLEMLGARINTGEYSCRCHGKSVISAPRLNRWSWNLLGTFYRVKLDCVPKDFVRRRFVLVIFAIRSEMAYSRFSAINFISPQRSNAEQNPLVRTFIIPQTIPLPSYSFNRLNCTSKSSI